MTRHELAKKIFNVSYLRGQFLLRSGQTSSEYFDKYQFEGKPDILSAIADFLCSKIPPGTEALAGLEMGGIPIATALSLKSGIPCCFVRKKAKEYGTCKFAEGTEIKNKKVCIIEDVITTGGQVILSAKDLRSQGAIIDTVLCVIDRSQNSQQLGNSKLEESQLNLVSLFTMNELKNI